MATIPDTVTGGIIFNDQAIAASNVASNVVVVERSRTVGLDISLVNNDAVGDLHVQVCNDLVPASPNWVDVAFSDGSSTIAVTSGTAINKFVSLWPLPAKYLRVLWAATSGTTGNTLRVVAHCKKDTN